MVFMRSLKVNKYTALFFFPHNYLRETTLGKNSCLFPYMSSKKGSTLKGKNLLLRSKFFSLKSCPHCKWGGGGGGGKAENGTLTLLESVSIQLKGCKNPLAC